MDLLDYNSGGAFLLIVAGAFCWLAIKIVPQQQAWIVERLGKYNKTLQPGLTFIVPFIDRVAYKHTLKEKAIDVMQQSAITKDNVTLALDGIIYVRIINPVDASYGVENPYYAVTQLAQTSMRSAIGKLVMDKSFEERDYLNTQIVSAINEAASTWGIQCMRYEIRDITPPATILKAMEAQVSSERQKRAEILESEGKMQSMINIAEGHKKGVVLNSEAEMADKINKAKGEAEAIQLVAQATAVGIRKIAEAMIETGGKDAVSMKIAQQYIEAFQNIAKNSNTVIIPSEIGNISSMVTQAMTIFEHVKTKELKPDLK
ncbi:SPFH domain-containing protein [Candidatus Bandiella euplotis]|uniref:Paraslipin domain protein n=1 Tax=Candidatus Bandiella euplotis TaxID=1664265 RepID=A0ABZ0UKC4_9RICK|nr:SPFH domain-containing protein [Candidatus Bandiella woodruffii]WPX96551.1 Paraslipin domain protein [Candidatus Bandiella woodruffii]